ncbi:MAG: thiol:disulfide interchange protein DsbA/DsbL [Azoarcus sp.]|jgi:thiol:disulfide interchange protein DsbA|nr:thiol:disulfide interchange protein DsbA/DsbL [Azoarcus sp.]
MNRRNALQQLGALALLASPVGLALGQAEGSFKVLQSPVPTNMPSKIEVLEFFHYGCSHCQHFEPLVAKWAKSLPPDVVFVQVPTIWSKSLEGLARLYYTLLVVKRPDLHVKIFSDVQEKGLALDKPEILRNWAKANKLDVSAFIGAYESFGVQTQVRRAQQLVNAYRIESVPTMAVAGRFLTSADMAGNSHEATLKVVDGLIERVRKGG